MNDRSIRANPLVSYSVFCLMCMLAVVIYLWPASGYGTFNANLWRPEDAALIVMISSILFFSGGLFYAVREFNVDVRLIAESQVDMSSLIGVKYFSLLSKHYGALTLMCTLLTFVLWLLKSAIPVGGIMLISFLMTIVVIALIGVYLLIFARTLHGSMDRHPVQVLALVGMLVFDAAFMSRAIELV
ncbi:hypothetical protein [Pseudomonas sp. JL3]|uniref:hypothetical protein n=1 Tax=Pseudomonas sp. JL3 TaxID=2919943 RepID=UPI00285A69AB|nr:hypothetical protein [Pseudomonas sp. JL3]MDR8365038.1 hypothetical protein [Pseudomonas sp. JL3]